MAGILRVRNFDFHETPWVTLPCPCRPFSGNAPIPTLPPSQGSPHGFIPSIPNIPIPRKFLTVPALSPQVDEEAAL